jgi:hypothetical protein
MNITVRDELKGLIQKAGIGASVALSDLNAPEKTKVLSSLKYPKNSLDVLWDDCQDLHTNAKLLVSFENDVIIVQMVIDFCVVGSFQFKCRTTCFTCDKLSWRLHY